MLLNIPQCTGWSPTTKNYLVQLVSNVTVEKLWSIMNHKELWKRGNFPKEKQGTNSRRRGPVKATNIHHFLYLKTNAPQSTYVSLLNYLPSFKRQFFLKKLLTLATLIISLILSTNNYVKSFCVLSDVLGCGM